jgi:glycopeptide antibiotics resistance protein|tara:strand:+ start:617 stop:1006 length:390 start_codon:yes stop_codon:yes gene_type:complete
MKNNILKLIIYLYYLSLTILLILYLFPGSLIGYLFYGDFDKQPNFIDNPIGTSINHFFYFFYLTSLGLIYNSKEKKVVNSFLFFLILSFTLELSHFFVRNRAFEFYDIISNTLGVLIAYLCIKLIRKYL